MLILSILYSFSFQQTTPSKEHNIPRACFIWTSFNVCALYSFKLLTKCSSVWSVFRRVPAFAQTQKTFSNPQPNIWWVWLLCGKDTFTTEWLIYKEKSPNLAYKLLLDVLYGQNINRKLILFARTLNIILLPIGTNQTSAACSYNEEG